MQHSSNRSGTRSSRGRFMSSSRKDQRVRIAWFYYIEGLTQSEVAKRVGLSRPLVNQILAACRSEGLIQIRLDSELNSCASLAQRLIEQFDLSDAVVIPTPAEPESLARVIGLQAGFYLTDRLHHDMKLAIGWGETLWYSLRGIECQNLRNAAIVSMLGGLTRYAQISAYETATRLADILSAHCYYMASPAYANDAHTRDIFMQQLVHQEVFERIRSCDMALTSVGQVDRSSTLYKLGLIDDDELENLHSKNAVGDLLGRYLDADGNEIDCLPNKRLVAAHPDHLRQIERVILASGGAEKIAIMNAVLRAGYANVVITDEQTAESLCQDE